MSDTTAKRPYLKYGLLLAALVLVLCLLIAAAVQQRHRILLQSAGDGSPNALLPRSSASEQNLAAGQSARWLDDYFLIITIDPQTLVIAEPRYDQQNLNYLIIGHDRAVLFDAGSGLRNVAAAAATLTDKPITFVPSHLHYDHIGNGGPFARTAMIDLPHLRARATTGEDNSEYVRPTWQEHLGAAEGYDAPNLRVDEWLIPGSVMSLGGRALRVLYTPGHTNDSISLHDTARGYLFSGDFMYQGPLYAFLPNSSLGGYQQGAETLLANTAEDVKIFGAHRSTPPGAPVLGRADIMAIQETLAQIAAGKLASEGDYPVSYPVNDRMALLAEPQWLQNWEQLYPNL